MLGSRHFDTFMQPSTLKKSYLIKSSSRSSSEKLSYLDTEQQKRHYTCLSFIRWQSSGELIS